MRDQEHLRKWRILMRVLNGLKKGHGTDDAKQLGGSFTGEMLRAPLPGTGEPHQGQGAGLDDQTINAAKELGILVQSDQGHWQLGRGIMDAIHRNEQPRPGRDFDQEDQDNPQDRHAAIARRVLRGLKKGFGTDDARQLGGSFTGEMLRAPLPGTGEPHQGQGAGLNDQTIKQAIDLGILVPSDEGHWKLNKSVIRP